MVLTGHVSPETAYLVADYPYGFRLRCQIRYWIETKKGQGQRVVSQTTNPKRPGVVWNKPKASTYSTIRVLYIDDAGHVQNEGLGTYADAAKIDAFEALYHDALTSERDQGALKYLRAVQRAQSRVTWRVTSGSEPTQTPEEQQTIMRAVIHDELKKDPSE